MAFTDYEIIRKTTNGTFRVPGRDVGWRHVPAGTVSKRLSSLRKHEYVQGRSPLAALTHATRRVLAARCRHRRQDSLKAAETHGSYSNGSTHFFCINHKASTYHNRAARSRHHLSLTRRTIMNSLALTLETSVV